MGMSSFQHITPALRVAHGPESLGQLARELSRLGCSRAAVFCGPWMSEGPLLQKIHTALGERCAGVYTNIDAHSPIATVEEASRALKNFNADAVIAVGGGSVIVTARAASILAAENKPVHELCSVTDDRGVLSSPKLNATKLPQLIVPTTPTTAIVKAGSAVFDPITAKRLAMYDPKTRAQCVFIDPDMVSSAPNALVVAASINTLSMAIEGLTSRSSDPIAEALLMQVVRLAKRHLSNTAELNSPALRGDLVMAAIMCGQGTDHTAAGITTVLGHAIGARYEKDNGLVNAIVLPYVLRFNELAAASGMSKVAEALGLPDPHSSENVQGTIDTLTQIFKNLGVPSRLRELGVTHEQLPELAQSAIGDWFLKGNPRPVQSASELEKIMKEAW